jgi:hypothetical protein
MQYGEMPGWDRNKCVATIIINTSTCLRLPCHVAVRNARPYHPPSPAPSPPFCTTGHLLTSWDDDVTNARAPAPSCHTIPPRRTVETLYTIRQPCTQHCRTHCTGLNTTHATSAEPRRASGWRCSNVCRDNRCLLQLMLVRLQGIGSMQAIKTWPDTQSTWLTNNPQNTPHSPAPYYSPPHCLTVCHLPAATPS